jgi:hypothetical protein
MSSQFNQTRLALLKRLRDHTTMGCQLRSRLRELFKKLVKNE